MTTHVSTDQTVWDVCSTCNVLWVSRSGPYDTKSLFQNPSARELAKAFQRGGAQWLGSDNENDVISCTTSKDTQSPAGVFSLQLKPRQEWLDKLEPGDLVFVFGDESGDFDPQNRFSGTLIMIGILDRPSRSRSVMEQGATVETISVSGRDLGVVFQETSTVFDPSFADIEQALFTEQYLTKLFDKTATAASPLENILGLLDLIYNAQATGSIMVGAQWRLQAQGGSPAPLVSLIDTTTFVQCPMFGYTLPDVLAIAQAGNVWTLLESYSNRLVHELFVDIRDFTVAERDVLTQLGNATAGFVSNTDLLQQQAALTAAAQGGTFTSIQSSGELPAQTVENAQQVAALVFRQLPYDRDAFMRLPETVVHETEVFDDETGKSHHDVFNFFRVRFPLLPNEYQELIYGIRINVDSVFRYGLRRMEAESRYMFGTSNASASYDEGQSSPQDFTDVFDYYISLLSTWYAANHQMRSGQITMRYRPSIRCGTRVRFVTSGKSYDYYVQGVSHQFVSEAGASRTSLTLVRGVEVGGDALANNLIWTSRGSQIPPELNTYGRFTAAGFELESSNGERILNDQQGLLLPAEVDTREEEE